MEKGQLGAGLSAYYISDTVQTSLGTREDQRWVIPSMTRYNGYFDYRMDLFDTETRFRFGVNNLTDERAGFADATLAISQTAIPTWVVTTMLISGWPSDSPKPGRG